MDNLYGYIFFFNPYTNLWNAIPREEYMDFFGKGDSQNTLKSKEISVLVEMIKKGPEFINSLT